MIVLDNVSKICIELIISRNDNAMEKFYRGQVDFKGPNFEAMIVGGMKS